MLVFAPVLGCLACWRDCCFEGSYFSEELEQWMTDGVTTETVEDGRSVVCSATHLTAFSVIAYDSQPVSQSLCTCVCVCVCVCVCACVCVCLMIRSS